MNSQENERKFTLTINILNSKFQTVVAKIKENTKQIWMNLPWILREFANGELSFFYLFWMKMKLKVWSCSYVMIGLLKFNPYRFIFVIPINQCQSLTGYMQHSTIRPFDNFSAISIFYFILSFRFFFVCIFLSK